MSESSACCHAGSRLKRRLKQEGMEVRQVKDVKVPEHVQSAKISFRCYGRTSPLEDSANPRPRLKSLLLETGCSGIVGESRGGSGTVVPLSLCLNLKASGERIFSEDVMIGSRFLTPIKEQNLKINKRENKIT